MVNFKQYSWYDIYIDAKAIIYLCVAITYLHYQYFIVAIKAVLSCQTLFSLRLRSYQLADKSNNRSNIITVKLEKK